MEYFVSLKRVQVVEQVEKITVPSNVYLVVLVHTKQDGSQWVEHLWTANWQGNPKKDAGDKEVEVHAVYQYDLSFNEIDKYDVYGDEYLKRL